MASGTFASQPTPPPVQPAARSAQRSATGGFDQYVEDQLRKTRAQVKLVDIIRNLLLLICGILAYMLVVALVDHWIVTLGFWTRTAALVALFAGAAWWIYAQIIPLLVRRINPVYAAYTIEQAEPSLKNSLINFLLLRGERAKVHDVVYQALGQRAASDISHVPADSVVDYNPLVRIGYVLAALVVLGAAYKILSPKDPVQSVARVMAPWADIDRATRVSIDDVRPGEAKIFQGEYIDVSAVLRGIRASDKVQVVFTTVDGQVVDQVVEMQPDSAGLRHLAKIPADEMGAQTSLHYKLVAGDAETKWYNVEVAPAPHVLVTKVHYAPPAYTKLPSEEAAHGDISGLEGTKVTIFARANREIESAYLEFDPVVEKAASATGESEARSLRITQIDGQNLQVSFQLRLADDRRTPWHKHYAIRYTSTEGHRNTRPIVHAISVKPDLAPLAEILSPNEREKTVPQNRMIEIEAKGIDLDFALSKLRLVAVSGGRDVMDVALVDSRDGQTGQVIKKLEFTPSHYALAVGDVVEYWAVAEDNRTSPRSGKPEPNVTSSTPTYRLIIGPPIVERAKPEEEEKPADGEHGEGEGSESSSGGQPQEGNSAGEKPQNEDRQEQSPRDKPTESGESGESGQSGSSGSAQDSSGSAGGEQESEESEGQGEGEGSQSSEGGTAGNSGSSSSEPSDSQSGNSRSANGQRDAQNKDASESSDAQSGGSPSGGSKPSDGNSEGAGESNEPLASDGSQDGDVFEKIQQHREQQEGGGASGAQQSGDAQQQEGNAQQQGGDAQQNSGEQNANPQNSGQQNSGNNSAGQSGNQQGEKPSGQQNGNQSGGAQSGGENQQGKQPGDKQSGGAQSGSQQGEKPQAGESGGQQQGGSQQSQDQGQKSGGQQGEQNGNQSGGQEQGAKPDQGSQSGSQQNQGGLNDQGQNKNASGGQEGGQPQGGAKPEGDKPSNQSGGQEQQNSSGGQGQNDKSGAGQESQSSGGSPESQAEKPQQKNGGEKSGGQQGGGEKKEESGKSPSGSNKSSDSQGESGGDRSGGGEQGGGQGAKKPGNDSAGSSSAGEQGDGAANEPGAGETGNSAGGDQASDSPTGRSGEQTGEGSSTGQSNDGGEKPQPKSGNQQGGDSSSSGKQPGGSRPQEGQQGEGAGEQVSDTPGQGRGTMPTGGGKPADNHPSDTPLPDIEPGADAANLDYARKSTDLTLEYLKNQKHNPDPKLLDDLGWTKDDLAKFIDRWDRMSRDAKTDATGTSKRKLDDSLRSLGLRPRTSEVRTDDTGGTRLSNQRETGTRTRPPKSYADQYRAFSKFITPATE